MNDTSARMNDMTTVRLVFRGRTVGVEHVEGVTKVVIGTNIVTLYFSEGKVLMVIPLDAIESISYPENLS